MDIILDAQVYVGLLLSHGGRLTTQSVFAELITYLRRTNSRLVIPKHVLAEVSKEYALKLSSFNDSARAKWNTRSQLLISKPDEFKEPDIAREVSAMEKMLLSPATGISTVVFESYQDISTEKVVERGVHRIPPSNSQGEELRDVVLWFIVLECAKKAEVAFITNDGHFKLEGNFHPRLLEEVKTLGLKVRCYSSISDFVTSNALTSESAQSDEITKILARQEIAMLLSQFLSNKTIQEGRIQNTHVSEVRFVQAEKYKVAHDSYFIQAKYSIDAFVIVREQYFNSLLVASSPEYPKNLFATPVTYTPAQTDYFQWPYGKTAKTPATSSYTIDEIVDTAWPAAEREYLCSFNASLSLRMTGGKRDLLELEKVELTQTNPVSSSGKPTEK